MSRHYPYLIIGGGMAGDAAVRGIRQIDTDSPVGLVSQEPDPPYNRPPLSKGLWKPGPRSMPLSRIWRHTDRLGVDLHLGRQIVRLDPANRRVVDDQGNEYTYGKLLLATGGTPIRLGPDHPRVIYFRTLADYRRLRSLTEQSQHFAVIGGGFIGSELAAALAGLGKDVVMIFPEAGIGARLLPAEISAYLNRYFSEKGIRVLSGHLVTALDPGESGVSLRTDQGQTLQVEAVVAGLGLRPNITLAREARLPTGDGIEVDPFLRTTHPDIFAAGDVVNFYSPALDRRMRVEHEENANLTGLLAGQGMAGQPAAYETLPSVYSTLFDISYDAVGDLDPRLEIIYDWQEPFQRGAAFYLDQQSVRGVLLWNQPHGLETARQLIGRPAPVRADDLRGLFTGG